MVVGAATALIAILGAQLAPFSQFSAAGGHKGGRASAPTPADTLLAGLSSGRASSLGNAGVAAQISAPPASIYGYPLSEAGARARTVFQHREGAGARQRPGRSLTTSGSSGAGLTSLGEVAPVVQGNRIARERALQSGVSLTPSRTEPYWACPEGLCEAIIDPPAHKAAGHWVLPESLRALEGSGEKGGYDPADLQSAYGVSTSGGEAQQHYEEKQTIALVDFGHDVTAESDLEKYRSHYGLPPCTKADGCFRQVNERGEEREAGREEWDLEISLDLDMASAVCPHCHILLVEASKETLANLAASANTAANIGATEVSNSYGFPENQEVVEPEGFEAGVDKACGKNHCQELDADYNHPGVVVTVGAGDAGYDNYLRGGTAPLFPAVSSTVIAVGGTSLSRTNAAEGRKWSDFVWERTGSGCSALRSKPAWQLDSGCAHRTDNDVAAVAACETPVSIYSSTFEGGWENVCGTSVSSPLVAGIEAHADESAGAVPTADAFYQDKSALYEVKQGLNGKCSPEYLCSAPARELNGYSGPAGNGTPGFGPIAVAGEPPSVRSEPTSAGGAMSGILDPNGLETTYCFEYGTTTSYGSCSPASPVSAGSGTIATKLSQIPGLSPGVYHYRLAASNADGTSHGEDEIYNNTPGPAVTAVSPNNGWSFGGIKVKIAGVNFINVTRVRFGSVAASFTVLSETAIEAVLPAGSGSVDVTVENAGGISTVSEADRFTYHLILPPAKLTGQGEVGQADFGHSVAVSADGNTALIGAYNDNLAGSAYVFARSGSGWAQQGAKLTPTPAEGQFFGHTVALSGDGDTAIVGGTGKGAWVFTRSGSSWTQQGPKLSLSGVEGVVWGQNLALSSDGNTALISGIWSEPGKLEEKYAAWVFTRSGSTWAQQAKLNGAEEAGLYKNFGAGGVALSSDGNTALIGSWGDGEHKGAAWVFTRSGSTWTQQGPKLTPTDPPSEKAQFGRAVALSGDGNTAMIGTFGYVWAFTRSGSTWTQQGSRLTGTEANEGFGLVLALSSEGNTALVGSREVTHPDGAWVFTRSGSTWTQQGLKLLPPAGNETCPGQGVALSADGATRLVGDECKETRTGAVYVLGPPVSTYSMSSAFFCLCIPTAVAADSKGHLFVADWYGSRVQEYGEAGEYLGQLGSAGSGPGQYQEPRGIAVDSKGNVWVADEGNRRVDEFNEAGGFVRSVGGPGSGPGQFQWASAVAADAKGDVWISDEDGRVQEFNEAGEYVLGMGSTGSGPGQFLWPSGIAIDAKGDVWAADMFNDRVQEFNEKGEYLGQFGSQGEGGGQLSYPDAVAVDSQGNVYVSDLGNGRVQEFTERGELFAMLGSLSLGPGQLEAPAGVTVDSKANVWVSEEGLGRVERWTPEA